VQSEREKKRFLAIGARLQQIEVMGNVKFDSSLPPLSESERVDTLWKAVPSFLVAGSTHHPEEHWLLESYRELRNDFPGLRLVLAPRNTSRAGAVEHLVRKSGLRPAQWSVSDKGPHNWDVLILDQTGWLPAFYARATAVIIGGSFANRGGHNLIEAAAQGRALIIGPHVQHFESIVEEFHRSEAILWLNSHRELTGALRSLLSDPNRRIDLGKKAGTLVESQRGVAQKYVRILMKKLGAGVFVPGNDRTTISFSQEKGPVHS
jgi:3-deoxy-D-manno-octulosonic-acid transferase